MRCMIALLSLASLAAAQEDSPLARLEQDVRALVRRIAARADGAVVTVGFLPVAGRDGGLAYEADDIRQLLALRGDAHLQPGHDGALVWQAFHGGNARGILVGTPPRVVVPHTAVGNAERITVVTGRGTFHAVRWGGDADLGIVVFRLPENVDLEGVEVEGDWARLGPGSIAVGAEGRGQGGPRLGLVAAVDARLGTVDAPGSEPAVFGSGGALIGLRGGPDMKSCTACHQSAAQTAVATDAAARAALLALAGTKHGGGPAGTPSQWGPGWAPAQGWMYEWVRSPWAHGGLAAGALDPGQLVAGPVIQRVLDDLQKFGGIRHAYLGVVLGDVKGERAVKVTSVVPGSPAAAAGLEAGQKIDAIDGVACPSTALFCRVLALHRPGEEVALRFATSGREIRVKLDERKTRANVVTAEMVGLTCVELGPELRRFLGLPDDVRGVAVRDVKEGSAAAGAGLRRGDVITRGGEGSVADVEELNAALAAARGSIELQWARAGLDKPLDATVTLPEPTGR